MSKISEQRASKEYPEDYAYVKCDNEDTNYTEIDDEGTKWLKIDVNKEFRTVYTKGYDQAMQDFLEKAEEFLYLQLNNGSIECGNIERLIEQFKNYMQDE